jgi:predicted outer membrane protein
MEQLRKLSGSDFDRAYMEYQIKMHEEAVSLVEKTSASADNPQLKQQLSQVVHDLRDHLTKANPFKARLPPPDRRAGGLAGPCCKEGML